MVRLESHDMGTTGLLLTFVVDALLVVLNSAPREGEIYIFMNHSPVMFSTYPKMMLVLHCNQEISLLSFFSKPHVFRADSILHTQCQDGFLNL